MLLRTHNRSTNINLRLRAAYGGNERATVCSDSPVAQRMIGTSELRSTRLDYSPVCNSRQARSYRFPMCRSRLPLPDPKSGGVRRELCPRGISYRSDGSCDLGDNHGPSRPRAGLQAGRPKHDPLVTGSLAAGEATGPRYGQGGYLELESMPSDPRPFSREAGGEGSGKRTYGGSP